MLQWLQSLLHKQVPDQPFGARGEDLAARHLRGLGYKILLKNYRCPLGEIDIIAHDGDTLVFVEVKTRVDDDPAPEEQVGRAKQHQLTRAAKSYLLRYGSELPPARFDVVGIVWRDGQDPIVRHTPQAFEATF